MASLPDFLLDARSKGIKGLSTVGVTVVYSVRESIVCADGTTGNVTGDYTLTASLTNAGIREAISRAVDRVPSGTSSGMISAGRFFTTIDFIRPLPLNALDVVPSVLYIDQFTAGETFGSWSASTDGTDAALFIPTGSGDFSATYNARVDLLFDRTANVTAGAGHFFMSGGVNFGVPMTNISPEDNRATTFLSGLPYGGTGKFINPKNISPINDFSAIDMTWDVSPAAYHSNYEGEGLITSYDFTESITYRLTIS